MNVRCDNYMQQADIYSSRRKNSVFLCAFAFFFFFLCYNDFSYDYHKQVYSIEQINKATASKPLTKENLLLELEANEIICPEQVYAQILIESGNLNSFLTKKTNNLLGMRFPFKRQTTASGIYLPTDNSIVKGARAELKKYRTVNNYAVYDTWEDCIRDYKYWQECSFKLSEQYLKFLGTYYAEDPLYVKKIKQLTR
jgi:hypothetical protein